MRLKLLIILFIVAFPLVVLGDYKKDVDSLIEASYDKYIEMQFIESLKIADKALQLSLKKNYSKGKAYSYLYIARILQVVGLQMEALEYIEKVQNESYSKTDAIIHAETHRIRGRVASTKHLYSLEKEHYLKQLRAAEKITDPMKKELSIIWGYFYIQHLYVKQNNHDSAQVYQNLLEKHLVNSKDNNASQHLSALYADKGLLNLNLGKFDEATQQLNKSLQVIESCNTVMSFYTLQIYGDLEIARGDTAKAIFYYKEALKNSTELQVNHKSMYLHNKISALLMNNDLTVNEAKSHLREYNSINDSLERHNKMLVDAIFGDIIDENDQWIAQKSKIVWYIVLVLTIVSIIIVANLIVRRLKRRKMLIKLNQQLVSKSEKIESLEEKLENNAFNDIIELAKSNSPEFLPLFRKSYPEFIEAMKQLDPACRSSELYFCALAYLNFSTKDISNFTFVSIRAVQIRKNRMRKKYNIPSEVDFNEWFRNLVN